MKRIILVSSLICLFLLISAGLKESRAAREEITFNNQVVRIFQQSCQVCHRPGDIAPFSLMTYRDARPWARSIREKVLLREMPPWQVDPRYGDFINDARLDQKDIDIITAWVDQGAKEGDPRSIPPARDFAQEWRIGKPDQVLSMTEEYVIEPYDPDNYVYFTIPTDFKEDRWVQAAEIRPGNRRVVHHAIAHLLTPRARAASQSGRAKESGPQIFYRQGSLARVRADVPVIDDGAKTPGGGAAFKRRQGEEDADGFSILLTSFAPGKQPDIFPAGMAKKIPAGSVIVLQMHYSSFRGASNKSEKDRTSIGLIFASDPPRKQVRTLTIPNHFFKIPAGADNHEVTASYTFEEDVELIDYMPHMHLRGKDMKYEAVYPDGRREILLLVPKFNFNWQTLYRLKKSLPVPKGTRMIVTAHFDNSAKNKYNPNPQIAVRWGDPTSDEMMIGWLDYAVPQGD